MGLGFERVVIFFVFVDAGMVRGESVKIFSTRSTRILKTKIRILKSNAGTMGVHRT